MICNHEFLGGRIDGYLEVKILGLAQMILQLKQMI